MITLHRGRQAPARPRVGRGERDRADAGAATGLVQARLRGRLGQVQARLLEDVPQRVHGLHRPGARLEGDRLQGARRLVLGAPGVAADAAELRPRADAACRARGSFASRTGRASLPTLEIDTDWAWHQWDHLFGTFRYANDPVYGFRSTSSGVPLDTFGRNVYVDTFDSAYGTGWKRENSFLTHTGTGAFCYSFNPHGSHPAGKGTRTARPSKGPGVTPDVMWQGSLGRRVRQGARPREERADHAARRSSVPRKLTSVEPLGSPVWQNVGAEQRALFRRWPAGVSVVVADVDGRRAGLTVSSLVSLSLEPPLVGISIALEASLHELLRDAGEWAASMLSRRAGAPRAALRAQRAADRALERDRGARGRSAPARGCRRLADRAHGRRDRDRRPHALRRRAADGRGGTGADLARLRPPGLQPGLIEAVVFDLDGVIVDSEQVWDDVRAEYARETGGRYGPDAARAMMGMSSPEWSRYMADELGVPGTPEQINADDRRADARALRRVAAADRRRGRRRARRCRRAGRSAIASSSNRELIEVVLAAAGLADDRRETVSSEEVARGKPAPDVYLEAARRLGVDAGWLRRGRGLAQRHPLREGGRDARLRDPESALPARRRGARATPTSCSASIAELPAAR